MNTQKILYLTFTLLVSPLAYSMKRAQSSQPIDSIRPVRFKENQLKPFIPPIEKYKHDSPAWLFLSKIQSHIYDNSDPSIMANLLWQSQAPLLDQDDKNKLYAEIQAFEQLLTIMPSPLFHTNLLAKKNSLYAFKLFPHLNFPQSFFTPVPYIRLSDKRPYLNQIIEALIKNEQEEISVCCYHLKLNTIATALLNQKNNGISIEIVTNQSQGMNQDDWWFLNNLKNANIPVLCPKNDKYEQMHHKFFIFKKNLMNKSLLVTGSYNPTPHGDTNSWDDILILDDQTIIDQYRQRFEEVKKRSK